MRNPTLKANEALTVCTIHRATTRDNLEQLRKAEFLNFFLFAAPSIDLELPATIYKKISLKFVKLVELFRAPKGAGAPRMKTTDLGRIHTRHFCTQYCNKKIKRHCDNLSIQSQRFLCQPR